MNQRRIDTDISNWVLSSEDFSFEAIAEQIEKRDFSLDDLYLVQSRENQMLYWPQRSREGEYSVLFFLDCWISANQRARN